MFDPVEYVGHLNERLPQLTRQQRVAFAAACANHVRQVYAQWWDDQDFADVAVEALKLAWAFVERKEFDRKLVDSVRIKAINFLEEFQEIDGIGGDEEYAMDAIISMLASLKDPTSDAVAHAAGTGIGCAGSGERSDSDAAEEEEKQWQFEVLDLIQAAKSAVTQELIDTVHPKIPNWLQEYLAQSQ